MTDSTKPSRKPSIARRYAYVRVTTHATVRSAHTEVCAGLEIVHPEHCNTMYDELRLMLYETFFGVNFVDDFAVTREFENAVLHRWPGRSYFCEVGVDDRYTQVFQPGDGDWLNGT